MGIIVYRINFSTMTSPSSLTVHFKISLADRFSLSAISYGITAFNDVRLLFA